MQAIRERVEGGWKPQEAEIDAFCDALEELLVKAGAHGCYDYERILDLIEDTFAQL